MGVALGIFNNLAFNPKIIHSGIHLIRINNNGQKACVPVKNQKPINK
jgi:hypothetical protein